jgi:hypothetical protein
VENIQPVTEHAELAVIPWNPSNQLLLLHRLLTSFTHCNIVGKDLKKGARGKKCFKNLKIPFVPLFFA